MRVALHKKVLSLRSRRKHKAKQASFYALSLRSRRKHKAWGASPRIKSQNKPRARDSGRQRDRFEAFARCRGLRPLLINTLPGACAPAFMLTPAIAG